MELKLKQEFELQRPEMPVPQPKALAASDIPLFTGSIEQDKALLRELVTAGARNRFGESTSKEIRERLDYELDVILRQNDVVSYLLIIQDFVAAARKMGAVVGPGRGPVAGSLVAYVLGITSVNPLHHDLLFERFINPDRIVHPWIMVDFDEEGQQKAFDYLARRYGKDHVARTCFDLCGLGVLTMQLKCLQIIRARTGECPDLDNIRLDDAETLELLARGETAYAIPFDTPEMQEWLRTLKPTTFGQLVILNGMSFPWQREKIPVFISRCQKRTSVECEHPLMAEYVRDTFGLTVFQEQVMLLSRRLADFTRGQSDKLRKALCKKMKMRIAEMYPLFIAGCLTNPEFRVGRCEEEQSAVACAKRIWSGWCRDAPYMFCKAHAVCSAKLAYQAIYLKAHYPEAWSLAVDALHLDQ